MPVQFDNYDAQKVDLIKNHLDAMASKNKAKFYEISVDNLKAVPKTDEASEFYGYEDYLTPDTRQLKIVIFSSGASPRNDQYVFSMKANNREEALLEGIAELPNKSYSRNDLFDLKAIHEKKAQQSREVQNLLSEIDDLNDELDEKCAYIKELEAQIDEAKANGNKIAGIDLSDIVSVAIESMVRRNTHLLAQIPAVQGLAGLIDQDTRRLNVSAPSIDTETTFKRQEEATATNSLSEQEQHFIAVFNELQRYFSEQELTQLMEILDLLSQDKTKMAMIISILTKK